MNELGSEQGKQGYRLQGKMLLNITPQPFNLFIKHSIEALSKPRTFIVVSN